MSDPRSLLERESRRFIQQDGAFERLVRRRDRKRRNQRITAGVVGIGIFVAAVWIVTTAGSFDRTQTPAATGPAATGPAETGPVGRPAPPLAHAPAAPDVVKQGTCSDGAISRLELTDIIGNQIKAQFVLHFVDFGAPPDDPWRITIKAGSIFVGPSQYRVFLRETRRSSGDISVWARVHDGTQRDGVVAKGVNLTTGQRCRAHAEIG